MSTPDTGDGDETSRDPRAAFAELSKIMLGEQQLSDILGRVAELAQQAIPGAAEVSVTLMQDGKAGSVAFTGPLASTLDERQYDAGFGPCMDAAVSGRTITIDDTAHSPVYPDFARNAHSLGVTHTMSVALPVHNRMIGALNIYGIGDTGFDEGTQEVASGFASYAALPWRTPASTRPPPTWRPACSAPWSHGR
ncbi:GAF domain-containing protein [Geodermatophilus sp. URMC 64]